MLSFFPRGVLDEILNLIESVSEGFPSYSFMNAATAEHWHWHAVFLVAFKMDSISRRNRIVDTGVVSDITCTRQSGHTIFMTRRYPLNNSDVK